MVTKLRSRAFQSAMAPAVLGIGAAPRLWQPSGVALWRLMEHGWECLRVTPSDGAFCGENPWGAEVSAGPIDADAILATCQTLLGGGLPAVVAASVPLARTHSKNGRAADRLINARFRYCQRPIVEVTSRPVKLIARRLHEGFRAAGYSLVTAPGLPPPASLIEVYPHVAMLGLLEGPRQVPYKIFNARAALSGQSVLVRRRLLVEQWRTILQRLAGRASGIDFPLPMAPEKWKFVKLKRFENAIDALVCAWTATEYLNGKARPVGDAKASIWVPQSAFKYAKPVRADRLRS